MNKQDKILITGASGLIGSALVRLLRAEGYESLLTPTHEELDWTEKGACEVYFYNTAPDYVFHLAAHVGGIQDNQSNPADFIYNNTLMQCNVLEMCREIGVKKLLFPGSACAYPRDAEKPIKESAFLTGAPEPTNLAYALAKQNGIVMAQSYAKQYGMNAVLPMVANAYGIGDKSSHVIPMIIGKICDAKKKDLRSISLWGTGKPLRQFIYADDVADAFLFLMRNYDSPEIINVGTHSILSIKSLAEIIAAVMDYRGDIIFDNINPDGVSKKWLDIARQYEIGWLYKTSIEDGLRRVINA